MGKTKEAKPLCSAPPVLTRPSKSCSSPEGLWPEVRCHQPGCSRSRDYSLGDTRDRASARERPPEAASNCTGQVSRSEMLQALSGKRRALLDTLLYLESRQEEHGADPKKTTKILQACLLPPTHDPQAN